MLGTESGDVNDHDLLVLERHLGRAHLDARPVDASAAMHMDMCIDMRIDMRIDMCIDMCIDMRIDMCTDMAPFTIGQLSSRRSEGATGTSIHARQNHRRRCRCGPTGTSTRIHTHHTNVAVLFCHNDALSPPRRWL